MSFLPLIVIVAVLFVVLAVVAGILKARRAGNETMAAVPDAYELRTSVFTPAERSFAGVLDGALPEGVTWLGKVRLGDVFATKKGLTRSENATARNKIDRKHVDFLLLRSSDLAPIAGIELDDRSHERDDRKDRDAFVDEVFRGCGLPLLHIPAQSAYNQTGLRAKLRTLGGPA
jgi:hypothetical protein